MRAIIEVAGWWATVVVVWVVTVSSVGPAEIVCALSAGLACAIFARRLRLTFGFRFRPSRVWLRSIMLLPVALIADIGMCIRFIGGALLGRPQVGRTRRQWGRSGRSADATAWRCAAGLIVSATPGTLVLDADPGSGELLLHVLWSSPIRMEKLIPA
ncbi:Na+/H+ antiporter subunit E [Rathayibacter soli]|uniref:Na+/H+ antiporter subunit E n=1 Tax=Rathayibacter soli TaxID=3144168 RepID=UPI0027E5B32B|nr:Na+/H+ antiporter subunit E [Glaciibacter superstes]